MKNKLISLMLGAVLGLMAGWGAYQSQYLRYFPEETKAAVSELPEKKIEYTATETIAEEEPSIETEVSEADADVQNEDILLCLDDDIPDEVERCAQIYGEIYDICPELLEAIAFAESSYISTVSNGSCVGLMQINLDCSEQIQRMESFSLYKEDMYEVDASMIVAADYLNELFEKYVDPAEVLMRYNGDKTGLKKYKKTGEISGYAKKILEMSEELERKHGK